jgi:LuxR family maltose regulon positive regulatory protein
LADGALALSSAHVAGLVAEPPPLSRDDVPRPRLVNLLVATDASLVLIAAPAGYGKTSLLTEWAHTDERTFAWLTLEEADNDGAQLLRRVALALARVGALEGSAAGELVRGADAERSHTRDGLMRATGALLRAISADRHATVLVLDDTEVLHSRDSRAVLKGLAVGMPARTALALASRRMPALPLGRTRAARALLMLEARDLAMSAAEAAGLVRTAGREPDQAVVRELVERTEGWPAGLSLAAQSLRDQPDVESAAAHFDGRDQSVAQYIREEVLAACAPDVRAFLVQTSVLEQLTAESCDALLAREDSHAKLAAAAAGNLMVMPVDRAHSGYRCHPLLRDVLETELDRLRPGAAQELHRRASGWFRERGELDHAVDHAVAARDPQLTSQLIWADSVRYLVGRSRPRLGAWLESFTDAQLAACPSLALCAAHEQMARGRLGMAEHWARVAAAELERSSRQEDDRSLAAGLGIIEAAAARRGVARMRERAQTSFELADETSPWRPFAALLWGVGEHLAGDPAAAREQLEDGVRLSSPRLPALESLCLAQLALIAAEENDWERASDLALSARARIQEAALETEPTSALVFALAAWVSAHEGLAAEAKAELRRATQLLELLDDYMPWYEVEARVALARASIRLADLGLARTLLAQASRSARRLPDAAVYRSWFDQAWSEIDDLGVTALGGACSLTMAELRILRFLPTHLSFREIGARLHVSTNTVKSQAHAIYAKLGVASRSEAVAQASALGLIEVDVI